MRALFLAGFVLMVIVQWYAPISMILDNNATVDEGTEYKFKTRPVDPSDPFRGKYITLSFDEEQYFPADTTGMGNFTYDDTAYAILSSDEDGYAIIYDLSADAPDADIDYLKLKVVAPLHQAYQNDIDTTTVPQIMLEFPFSTFYMEESKASDAEKIYWSSRTDSTMVCYALVKVRKGKATLTDVMVNDSSIVDIVRKLNTSPQ